MPTMNIQNSLVQYCLYCTAHGYPLTHRILAAFATMLRRKRHPGGNIPKLGKMWWRNFRASPYKSCKERKIVVAGFRNTGIFPSVMDESRLMPSEVQPGPGTSTISPGSSTTTPTHPAAAQPSTSSATSTTTTSDSGHTISPSLCDSPGAPAAGHLPLPPPIPSAILQPPARPSAAPPACRQRFQPPARPTQPTPPALSDTTTGPAFSNASEEEEENEVCGVCSLRGPETSGVVVSWVQCSHCGQWFHTVCVQWVVDNLREDKDYFCSYCSLK
ncbi:hypothetical protein SKAU_G00194780 [Synaphobranchus kaupii]|uniref:PHD-type domain-containing protein n=1 Tax=Synaphobranchus kaupii TaxID=118154 RepID=A0A9Q1FEE1_SYNKA|nr:hypothetical protein SKAU_G00194780 [Synaphobranchus kaupii]